MTEPFLGEIRPCGFDFAPRGWALCNGQLLAINQNQALFSLLGTQYGGNGTTTFALPDLRGRSPIHWGSGAGLTTRQIGEKVGQESVTLVSTQIPTHTHTLQGATAVGDEQSPAGAVVAMSPEAPAYSTSGTPTAMAAATVGAQGGGQAHPNMAPFLAINFIIALQGIFPSRA